MIRSAAIGFALAVFCLAGSANADICSDTLELADRWQEVANYVEANKVDGFSESEIVWLTDYLVALDEWTMAVVDLVNIEGDTHARGLARRLDSAMDAAGAAFRREEVELFVDRIDAAVDVIDELVRSCG